MTFSLQISHDFLAYFRILFHKRHHSYGKQLLRFVKYTIVTLLIDPTTFYILIIYEKVLYLCKNWLSKSENDRRTPTTFWNTLYEKPRMNVSIYATRRQVSSKFIFILQITQLCFLVIMLIHFRQLSNHNIFFRTFNFLNGDS